MRLVLVEWWDSHAAGGGWSRVDQIEAAVPVLRSVGWVLHDTPECLVLVANHGEAQGPCPEQACGEMTIPKRCVKRVHALRDPAMARGRKRR